MLYIYGSLLPEAISSQLVLLPLKSWFLVLQVRQGKAFMHAVKGSRDISRRWGQDGDQSHNYWWRKKFCSMENNYSSWWSLKQQADKQRQGTVSHSNIWSVFLTFLKPDSLETQKAAFAPPQLDTVSSWTTPFTQSEKSTLLFLPCFLCKLDFCFLVSTSQPLPRKVSPHAGFKLSIEMQTLLG